MEWRIHRTVQKVERAERDRLVRSLSASEDRAQIETVVDELLDEASPLFDEQYMLAATGAFDARAESLPVHQKVVAWQIAAALREQASPASPLH